MANHIWERNLSRRLLHDFIPLMNIVQITPGAGGMYCGNCFRDNALVSELRAMGHETMMIPLYLPMTLEDADQSSGTPIFFSGINVYLEQLSPLFSRMPHWLHGMFRSPGLLKLAAGRAAKTRADELGELTLSMLRGEEGNQAREVEELAGWLKEYGKADLICLSNALLVGVARGLKQKLNVPVICTLQGEDYFLDALKPTHRERTWTVLSERAQEIDLFIAPSVYFAQRMSARLKLDPAKVRVIHNGIDPSAYTPATVPSTTPVLGYFARMCREKGVDTVVKAFILLRKRNKVPGLKLRIGGGMGPSDEPVVAAIKQWIAAEGLTGEVEFFPNLDKKEKQSFFKSLSVMSVPALYGEAFGLYLLEAWAAGVPVVQPATAAFPELISHAKSGLLCDPGSPESLALKIEELLLDEPKRQQLARNARAAVEGHFSLHSLAEQTLQAFASVKRSEAVAV
ncbi:MAG: glycosyltransferase family 4 protein [Verrucomicrobiota bacterium]|nr:glycosyltransferase family 4 protein [Verrucomicrobiota bacterium]